MDTNYRNIWKVGLLLTILILSACNQDESIMPENKDNKLMLAISTLVANDNMVKNGDSSFSSLALYIFNESNGVCEYSELIPEIKPESVTEITRSVNISPQTKEIYAIGNYNATGIIPSQLLTSSTTRDELEKWSIKNNQAFIASGIPMVGKQTVTIDNAQTYIDIPMERLVSRLDIHLFKNNQLKDIPVHVKSVELVNQVTNTNGQYKSRKMLSPVEKQSITTEFDALLDTMSMNAIDLSPENAQAIFYSYQNSMPSPVKDDNITPYLRITAEIKGIKHIYKGYITDNGHNEDKYNLLRNTVYSVIAMLEYPDNKLLLRTIVQPWTVSHSEIGYKVNDTDYLLEALNGNDTGALGGFVQFPYIKNGQSLNQTSYAGFTFKLSAPAGALWTATLTNGLEFAFATVDEQAGTVATSKGIAGPETHTIRIGATKPWDGKQRATSFYITVNGTKLKINPEQNGKRKFPGNSDTDILITQMEYK